ncbi:MAG: hypothetical protein KKA67_04330, partial [Spirochaetes bacterium]|nr:hypothetical protein [Spirochaetota bacterium]
MRRFFDPRAIATGVGMAAIICAASLAVAAYGLENVYYASVFIPLAMLCCLAIAWFSFLRDDGFSGGRAGAPEPSPAEPAVIPNPSASPEAGAAAFEALGREAPGGPGLGFYAPRDGSLVRRGSVSRTAEGGRSGAAARAALLWAAISLGAAAA